MQPLLHLGLVHLPCWLGQPRRSCESSHWSGGLPSPRQRASDRVWLSLCGVKCGACAVTGLWTGFEKTKRCSPIVVTAAQEQQMQAIARFSWASFRHHRTAQKMVYSLAGSVRHCHCLGRRCSEVRGALRVYRGFCAVLSAIGEFEMSP